jgi:hypothetical protein
LRLAEASVADARARYDLGCIVHTLRYDSSERFRSDTLRNLARRLATHPSALRKLARIAETIGPKELDAYLERRDSSGMPLTWSHIATLSRIRSVQVRQEWAAKALAHGLSVRQLAARIHPVG